MPSLLDKQQVPAVLATLDPNIPIVSPNQLSIYNRCAWSWDFRYTRNFHPIPTKDYAETGLILHHLLEIYYNSKKDFSSKSNSYHILKVYEALSLLSKKFTTYDQMQQVTKSGRIVLRYIKEVALEHDKGLLIQGVEKHFVVPMVTPVGRMFYLQGYVDLLSSFGRGSIIDDHKSTNGNNRFYTPNQVQMDLQLKTYAVALRKLGYNILDVAIRNYNTYIYKDFEAQPAEKLFKRTKAHYSEKELVSFEREIGYIVDEMLDIERPRRRSISKDCAGCFVQEACLFDMKGMNLTRLLAEKYTRRKIETYKDLVIGIDKPERAE